MGYRATQIGVVSRGLGCAEFNSPAVFASIKKIFPWIKQIVEANMNQNDFCTVNRSISKPTETKKNMMNRSIRKPSETKKNMMNRSISKTPATKKKMSHRSNNKRRRRRRKRRRNKKNRG